MACGFLQACGFVRLAGRYRRREGEIDLVMRRRELLIFVEVKVRRSACYGPPEAAVTRRKLIRLRSLARHYLQEHPEQAGSVYRFDVVSVEFAGEGRGYRLRHIPAVC
jgi:putative endonuclease